MRQESPQDGLLWGPPVQRSKHQAGLMPSMEVCIPRARPFVAVNFTSAFALASGRRDGCRSQVAPTPYPPSDQINAFLTHLAMSVSLSASSQNQPLGALLIFFRNLQGTPALVAQILYGRGLRLMEALCLRIKDVHFEKNSIVVRDGKGDKDRITMLPESLKASLQSHLTSLYALHQKDLSGATTSMPARYRKRCVQPLGHSDVKTTIIYTHVLNRGVVGVKSPADLLFSWQPLSTRSAGKPWLRLGCYADRPSCLAGTAASLKSLAVQSI